MSLNELIIDTIEPEEKDAMHIHPSRFNTAKYLSKNIFDRAIIRHSTVDQITSNGLSSIYSCLKPEGKIIIIVHQPIGIMVFYDTKQIEANLKLAGFENIKITDTSYPDEKLNTNIPTQQIEAEKLKTEKNYDVRIEVQKTTKENKTYVKKEVREEVIIKDKKDENKETGKYKNRTYVREQKEEKKENSDNKIDDNNNSMEEKRKYIQRRYRFKKNS